MTTHTIETDPYWYKDAVIYELHVRAFADSNDDGIGDFKGLTTKLDYLQDLGVTALWLLPFYPSPLKDDGYDIADYTGVHPRYGTLSDVKNLIREAHRRGLKIITELVLNHTSDQHPWFQRARHAPPGSAHRDFYVWSDDPERYRDARIIFQDFETSNWTWDSVAESYYWHRFYSHQPDLNFESPQVRRAVFRVVDFWLKLGVDGLRLDAVPYLYEHEGTTGENLHTTHSFLKELRAHIDARFSGRMLLAEANQWPEDAVAYFGEGDECNMAFHFPLMPRLFMATQMEDRFPVVDILAQTPPLPESAQWALFLRNHDELTLEMVTDEERIYMYRAYAQDDEARINLGIRRRLAPLMSNNRRRIELMNGLLFALPGTPVLYYGDEIGMGDNMFLGDRNGVRTPMQWSPDRNAGFSRANPQRLYLPLVVDHEYHYETVNVEAQQRNPQSLLAWMRRLIALRKRFQCFGRGSLELLDPSNPHVLAFVRRYEDECVLVVANLSRFAQAVELNLQDFAGTTPVELVGRSAFPQVSNDAYPLTLSPHSFFWFSLAPTPDTASVVTAQDRNVPQLTVAGAWDELITGQARDLLRNLLPEYLHYCAWFGGKARHIVNVRFVEVLPLSVDRRNAYVTSWQIDYATGDSEIYMLPLTLATGAQSARLAADHPEAVVAHVRFQHNNRRVEGMIYDALWSPQVGRTLLNIIAGRRRIPGRFGALNGLPYTRIGVKGKNAGALEPRVIAGEQNNTSLVFGEQFVLKVLRRIDSGVHPEVEMGAFLNAAAFPHVPLLSGAIEYQHAEGQTTTLAVLQRYTPHETNGRDVAMAALNAAIARSAEYMRDLPAPSPCAQNLLALAATLSEGNAPALLGDYAATAHLIGRRTAELHQALAADTEHEAFAPEHFTSFSRRALYQSLRNLTGRTLATLRRQLHTLNEDATADATPLLAAEATILKRFQTVLKHPMPGPRIRTHGDYHLEQILHTADDLLIIDFEGEPSRMLAYRRLRHSPLQDVVAMIRSFFDAAVTVAEQAPPKQRDAATEVTHAWAQWAAATFLKAYLEHATPHGLVPKQPAHLERLLDMFLLERVLYEVAYELNNRPDRAGIALRGAALMLGAPIHKAEAQLG